jgi:hypothetical protein
MNAGWAESAGRFGDGRRYHYEIASVEGPAVFRAVLDEASSCGLRIHRVSQGSGVMMLSNAEITEMVELGRDEDVEVCLFLGPRGGWDIGGQAFMTGAAAGVARGAEAVQACIAEANRACALGIRSLLVGDVGVLDTLSKMRTSGALPPDLIFKTSAVMVAANPATMELFDRLGADTINVATDLTVSMLADVRSVSTKPIDAYIEVPDELGGFVRAYEVPDIVRAAAPVHLKFGLRNARNVYPSGLHLQGAAIEQAREKVRRAALTERLLGELAPELID